jgi:hypothetical protein
VKPATHDIEVYRGDTYELFVRIRTRVYVEGVGWTPGPYKDLTGYTGTAQIRTTEDAADPPAATFTVTIANQVTTLGGVLVRLTPAQTAALVISSGVWDMQLSDGTDVWTYVKGNVTVSKDVSRV